jgi:hypothetical protein
VPFEVCRREREKTILLPSWGLLPLLRFFSRS